VYYLVGKKFHRDGMVRGDYYLCRANDAQRRAILGYFGNVSERYTECLFHPDLKFWFPGRDGSLLGKIDAYLGDYPWIGRWIARQHSFEAIKR